MQKYISMGNYGSIDICHINQAMLSLMPKIVWITLRVQIGPQYSVLVSYGYSKNQGWGESNIHVKSIILYFWNQVMERINIKIYFSLSIPKLFKHKMITSLAISLEKFSKSAFWITLKQNMILKMLKMSLVLFYLSALLQPKIFFKCFHYQFHVT